MLFPIVLLVVLYHCCRFTWWVIYMILFNWMLSHSSHPNLWSKNLFLAVFHIHDVSTKNCILLNVWGITDGKSSSEEPTNNHAEVHYHHHAHTQMHTHAHSVLGIWGSFKLILLNRIFTSKDQCCISYSFDSIPPKRATRSIIYIRTKHK